MRTCSRGHKKWEARGCPRTPSDDDFYVTHTIVDPSGLADAESITEVFESCVEAAVREMERNAESEVYLGLNTAETKAACSPRLFTSSHFAIIDSCVSVFHPLDRNN